MCIEIRRCSRTRRVATPTHGENGSRTTEVVSTGLRRKRPRDYAARKIQITVKSVEKAVDIGVSMFLKTGCIL